MRWSDVLVVSVAIFAGFELALAANYFLLKFVLRAMRLGRPQKGSPGAASALR